jgi:hypothetical protein
MPKKKEGLPIYLGPCFPGYRRFKFVFKSGKEVIVQRPNRSAIEDEVAEAQMIFEMLGLYWVEEVTVR